MCTVTVEAATPSAAREVGDAVKVELVMLNPVVEANVAVDPQGLGPMVMPLTVAVKLTVPGVDVDTEKTAFPKLSVVPVLLGLTVTGMPDVLSWTLAPI